ncbi:MAG: CsgG/HfaB family protein [Planctomycetaceae bacterium]
MKFAMCGIVTAILFGGSLPLVADEPQASVPPLAVFPFAERGSGAEGYGSKISDFLVAALAENPDLIVVDRDDLKSILDEQKLNLSGLVKSDEAVQVGRLTGAKILISGSVVELDSTLLLSAKLIGTETGRLVAASVKGKTSDDLAELAQKLADKVLETISKRSDELLVKPISREDHLAALKEAVDGKELPKVWIQVTERHIGQATIDPAAETEIALLFEQTGFTVIDHKDGNRKQADVIVEGEAFSEFATRHGDLVSVKARVEIKAVHRKSGERIATDRQTEIAVDLSEQIAGKTALQKAAEEIAIRLIPKVVE